MQITKLIMPESKYTIKCPYGMEAEGITVHNTYNDASAMAEASYMIGNNNKVSFHEVIDDYRVVHCIDFNRNSWNAGDGKNGFGNRKTISIEICYSKSGGDKFNKAEENASKRIAQILKERNWGIERVGKHQDRSKKYCPHRTLDLGWERFLDMIRKELGQASVKENLTVQTANTYTYKDFVKEVQNAIGAKVDGIAGKETLSKTVTVSKRKNNRHAVVKPLQRYLNALGFDCGAVDGIAGKLFDNAVKSFQKANGCVCDGEITARNKTWKKLLKLA